MTSSSATTTSYTVTGLTNDTAHTFKIRAVNASGNGVESDEKSATPKTAPSKPTGFTATAKDKSVELTWTDPGDSTINKWEYQRKSGGGNYGAWTQMSTSATATSYTVSSLTNNTTYTFRIRAWNAYGNGPVSDEQSATPVPPPAKPTGLSATAKHEAVELKWTDPDNSTITGWSYSKNNGSTWTDIPNSSATTTSYTVTGLNNGTTYTFKIRALSNSGNSAASAAAQAKPLPVPSAPANLTASPSTTGPAKVTLNWNTHSDTTITKWQYRYKVSSSANYGDWSDIPNSAAATKTYTQTGLHHNVEYNFQVRAVNAIGIGDAEFDDGAARGRQSGRAHADTASRR